MKHQRILALGAGLSLACGGISAGAEPASAAADSAIEGIVITRDGMNHTGKLEFNAAGITLQTAQGEAKEFAAADVQAVRITKVERGRVSPAGIPRRDVKNGLFGAYHPAPNFGGEAIGRIDPTIHFDWQGGAPINGVPADGFSVRWEGEVESPITGMVNFHTRSDDGVRLWVDGRHLINDWTSHPEIEHTASILLEAGKRYPIRIEYFDGASIAAMKLFWSGPGLPRAVVPAAKLFNYGGEHLVRGRRVRAWLKGGSLLVGELVGIEDKSIRLRMEAGSVNVPRAAIGMIDILGGTHEGKMLEGRLAGALLANNEFVPGKLESFDEDGRLVMFSAQLGRQPYAIARFRAVKFADIETKEPAGYVIQTRWASLINVDSIRSKGDRLIVRDNSRFFLNIPAADVAEIRGVK